MTDSLMYSLSYHDFDKAMTMHSKPTGTFGFLRGSSGCVDDAAEYCRVLQTHTEPACLPPHSLLCMCPYHTIPPCTALYCTRF
jgi:hypothetical protein